MTSRSNVDNTPVGLSLKSKILKEILVPDCKFSLISKKYNLSTTTLYNWRRDHIKSLSPEPRIQGSPNNFIELLPDLSISSASSDKISNCPKLSEISLKINDIRLSVTGNITTAILLKILSALNDESAC